VIQSFPAAQRQKVGAAAKVRQVSFIATGGRVWGIRVKGWCVAAQRVSALGAVLGVASCTLTQDSFEPRRIEAEQTQSGGLAPTPTSPSATERANGTPNTPTATTPTEQELPPEVALASGDAQGEEGGQRGEGQLGATDADEGVGVSATAADAGAPQAQPNPPGGNRPGNNSPGSNPSNPPADNPPDADAPPVAEPCPGSTFGGSCYEFFAQLAAWPAAEQACVGWGGHLASVSSAAEDTFLASWPQELGVPAGNGAGLWLGASDTAQDAVFQWTDASAFNFPGWGAAQPDNGPSVADCVEKRNDGTAAWYDRHCTDQLVYVCEKPL
jgi:hypothetical protein